MIRDIREDKKDVMDGGKNMFGLGGKERGL